MNSGLSGVGISRKIPHLLLMIFASVLPLQAGRWDSKAAAQAFESATRKKAELSKDPTAPVGKYLECAREFRKVFLKDPHFSRAGEAIYQEGILYQEMGERFRDPQYYKTAVQRFRLLVRDYGGSQNCPDALIRMGEIYSEHLKDPSAAREAYSTLKLQYPYSKAAISLAHSPPEPAVKGPATPVESEVKSGQPEPYLQGIRFVSASDSTRVTIDFDADVSYSYGTISSPNRLYLDIPNARMSNKITDRTFQVSDPRVNQIRVGRNRPDLLRIVLDLAGKCTYSISAQHDPFRVVVDLRREQVVAAESKAPQPKSVSQTSPADTAEKSKNPPAAEPASKPSSPPAAKSPVPQAITPVEPSGDDASKRSKAEESAEANTASKPLAAKPARSEAKDNESETASTEPSKLVPAKLPPMKAPDKIPVPKPAAQTSHGDRTLTRMLGLKIGKIVLDPGHGGHDLGTIGPGGLYEKDLVLSIALRLRRLLQDNLGAEVILTRHDDTFVPLEERTAIANEQHADLFVSIHANSSRFASVSGVETYFLDFARTDSEREIAARENATSLANFRDLEDLVKKIAQAEKSLESRELASIVQKRLYAGARRLSPATQNRGVRSAPFVVLIGANMPSVLAEVSFISNPKDERLLRKGANQEFLAKALYSGIEGYMKTLGSDVVDNQISSKSK